MIQVCQSLWQEHGLRQMVYQAVNIMSIKI